MSKNDTIPAEAGKTCDCCGRIHRKLHYNDGFWLGGSCEQQYKIYRHNKDITALIWRGYEKQYHKVERMLGK